MLDVETAQILDLLLPEFSRLVAAAAPGGDAEGDLGKNLNPFKRKRDKPVAFWSGIIRNTVMRRPLRRYRSISSSSLPPRCMNIWRRSKKEG